jgi:plasmid stabilization system protein ParE
VPRYRFVPAVEADIERALRYTRRRFGHAKYLEYAALIEEALQDLGANARSGKLRPLIHPDAWIYEIAQPGRKARHLFLYEIVDDRAYLYGLLYDGMDLPARWKRRKRMKTSEDE